MRTPARKRSRRASVRRAFRRPTTQADEQALLTAYSAGRTGGSYAEGIEVMIRAALQSPDFLYRLETTPPADANAALVPLSQFRARDAALLPDLVHGSGRRAARRARKTGRSARVKRLRRKHGRCSRTRRQGRARATSSANGRAPTVSPSPPRIPTSSRATRATCRPPWSGSCPAFMEYVLWKGDHTLKTLLTAPVAFVSGPLAQLYVPGSPVGDTTPVKMDSAGRARALRHPHASPASCGARSPRSDLAGFCAGSSCAR